MMETFLERVRGEIENPTIDDGDGDIQGVTKAPP